MTPSIVLWAGFNALIVAIIAVDLTVGRRRPAVWTAVWIALALAFGGWLAITAGQRTALEYVTCYLLELSLSVDNIVVMIYLFSSRNVRKEDQHSMLMWGVLGAIVMRGVFILAGTTLLERFEWITYVFAATLIWGGIRLAMGRQHKASGRSWLRLSPYLTTLLLIETADLIFAVDSVPAAFAVSRDPFVVYTANIFAVIGLRSLYSILAPVVGRIRYLDQGLAAILIFVGGTMALESQVSVPSWVTLLVVIGVLGVTVAVSRFKLRRRPVV
jgi:predicted tellurium resistance membrane protein TerC